MRRVSAPAMVILFGTTALAVACDRCESREREPTAAVETSPPGTPRTEISAMDSSALLRGLARATGAKYADEVESIVHTGVFSARLSHLDGVEHFNNLRFLNLPSHFIRDVGPLSTLDRLESLYLNDNRIDDLTPLASLSHLESLHICHNRVDDIRPLAPLAKKLTELVLSFNEIGDDDLQWLVGFGNVKTLALEGNKLTDVGPLSQLTQMEQLYLSDNAISNVEPLAALTALKVLYLRNNTISKGVAGLVALTSLEELDVRGNDSIPCRDLEALEKIQESAVVTRPETCVAEPH